MNFSSRYGLLRDRMATQKKTSGKYESKELEEIMKHVLAFTGGEIGQSLPDGVDWDTLATQMNRSRASVYDVFRSV